MTSGDPLSGRDEIVILPYSDEWIPIFEREKKRLSKALGSQIASIEHIGSTAVPGLSAKPVIDMVVGVRSMKEADALLPVFEDLGYLTSIEFNKTLQDERFLMKLNDHGTARTHHVHIIPYQGPNWKKRIAFRDLLRSNAVLAEEYCALKIMLSEKFKYDRENYTQAKTHFIEEALQKMHN